MYDLIIIGGGPAGISAGIYSARKKIKTLLVAKSLGGQPVEAWQIDNYPGFPSIMGAELTQNFTNHIKKFKENIEIKEGESVVKIERTKKGENGLPVFEVQTEKEKYETKSIIIASGVNPRRLDVPGEEKFSGRGVVYCATCDAPLFNGKTVAVVGAGNSGLDAALQLTKYAKKIYLINKYPELKVGDPAYQEKIKNSPLIEIVPSSWVKEIKGEKFVNGIVLENLDTKKINEINVEGVFVEIGSHPSLQFAKHMVKFNEKGEIVINPETNESSQKGVFAAGDVTTIPYKQIIISAGEGAKAALSAYYYLTKTANSQPTADYRAEE
jgi:thioredoxin-disulfide reductase